MQIDLNMARDFLRRLDPGGTFTFQTFAEGSSRKDARVLHGTFEQHADALAELNRKGHGVFVMVNRGDGITRAGTRSCRTNANVTAVRAVFVDLDGASPVPLLHAEPKPAILVESSPGRYHAYWLVNDCELEMFGGLQKSLAAKFDGDRSVSDLARVMRIPGFVHQKHEPFLTRVISLEDVS